MITFRSIKKFQEQANYMWVDRARKWIPRRVRYAVQRFVPLSDLKQHWFSSRNPLAGVASSDDNAYGSPVRLGIVFNRAHFHRHFVAACREMSIPFRVLDLSEPNWDQSLVDAECGLIMAWPDATLTPWAKMIKDRLDLVEIAMGIPVFPRSHERWMYEDKNRMIDWMRVHGISHPRTWIFHDRSQALEFASSCVLPIVFKTSFGAAASGVRIFRRRRKLLRLVRKVFSRGVVPDGHDLRDRQWRHVLLQEYLPDIREWRLVRIGDSYFGHPKGQVGEFHSGSGVAEWDMPENRHMDLLFDVTEKGNFRSMNVDVFEMPDGRLLVNELQTVFGAATSIEQMKKDGQPGRMIRTNSAEWQFEAGSFARNACANERVRWSLENLVDSVDILKKARSA